jgi:flagellar motor switch protein FliN
VAENPNQPQDVPQRHEHVEPAEEATASRSVDAPRPRKQARDADAQTVPLQDGDSISQEDFRTLLNAAEGGSAPSADDPSDSLGGASDANGSYPERDDGSPDTQPFDFPELMGDLDAAIDPKRVTMLNDVNLRVRLQLGQTRMYLEDVLKLSEGSVVELDKLAGDPVDVLVNDRLVARGEVLVLNDVFCVRICEVLSNDPHRITV